MRKKKERESVGEAYKKMGGAEKRDERFEGAGKNELTPNLTRLM